MSINIRSLNSGYKKQKINQMPTMENIPFKILFLLTTFKLILLQMEQNKYLKGQQGLLQAIERFRRLAFTLHNLDEVIKNISSANIAQQHHGVIGIRKILSAINSPPIQPLIDAGLVPKLIQFSRQTKQIQLQIEALRSLTIIASGTTQQTRIIVNLGGIPLLIGLLKSDNKRITGQAIWAVGNIASKCSSFRDMIIAQGVINNLCSIIGKAEQGKQDLIQYVIQQSY